jgi:hypothetical protein
VIRKIIEHALESLRSRVTPGRTADEVQAALEKLNRRRMRLTDAYEKEVLSLRDFETRLKAIEQEESLVRSWLVATEQPDVASMARQIARGALAFRRIKDHAAQKTAIDQLFSKVVFRGNKIISFTIRPQFAVADSTPLLCAPPNAHNR